MFKSKTRVIVFTFSILIISLFISNKIFAFSNMINKNEESNWKVTITNDTKDLEDTQEISFKIQENPNVKSGKIAPGMKAIASIQVDTTDIDVPVDIILKVDDKNLYKVMSFNSTIDNQSYEFGSVRIATENTKHIINIELEWKDICDELDTYIGENEEIINVPFFFRS